MIDVDAAFTDDDACAYATLPPPAAVENRHYLPHDTSMSIIGWEYTHAG